MRKHCLAFVLVGLAGCPSIDTDPGEGPGEIKDGPTVEFDPAHSIVPFPNDLVRDPATGKVNLPAQCNESPLQKAVRENVLNKLDGFGTYETGIQVTFTAPVDMASLAGNIVLFERVKDGTAVDPASAAAIPVAAFPATTQRFDLACSAAATVDAVNIVPLDATGTPIPLDQRSTYVVAVLAGVKTADGKDFGPSFTWALVRQSTDPVTLDPSGNVTSESTPLDPQGDANGNGVPDLMELQGLDLLWKAHAKALAFLEGKTLVRSNILLAWEFTTQTTTDPLDATVATSPAAMLPNVALLATASVVPGGTGNTRAFIEGVYQQLGLAPSPAAASALCDALGCDFVGNVIGAGLGNTNFQVLQQNPFSMKADIPGAWSDPVHPSAQGGNVIRTLAFVPTGTAPAGGWPVVVFGHGLGSRKESLFVFAPQLARAGFASVAIDFVDHGDRAVRTSSDAALGCADVSGVPPEPSSHPQCYAPFLSADLAATRDNFRQTVLDLQRLVKALTACGESNCGPLTVDPNHIVYTGISLGGILGSIAVATTPTYKGAVLNVPGAGWGDILENTSTLEIRCTLVNALIDAGILVGEKWNPTAGTGLCTTQAWQQQPGYQQFRAIARWVLDPSDPANFTRMLAMRRILIQEVVGDQVVPNIATDREGALVGLMPKMADVNPGNQSPLLPSMAITAMPKTNLWVRYADVPANAPFPGNAYEHASLLRPAAGGSAAGQLGTQRVQTDAIFYLLQNH
jgi:dienelactone hydrolase